MDKEKQIKLKTLEADVKKIGDLLQEAAQTIINQEVSNYPLFVAHQHAIPIGIDLFDKDQLDINWSFNASTLEEMVAKKVVLMERLEDFKAIYKSPDDFVCIFVVDDLGSEFIFYPYPKSVEGHAISDQ